MSKKRIDEGLMKYVIKLFFPNLESDIVRDPEVQQILKEISSSAQRFNDACERLEKRTGVDFSDIKFKRK